MFVYNTDNIFDLMCESSFYTYIYLYWSSHRIISVLTSNSYKITNVILTIHEFGTKVSVWLGDYIFAYFLNVLFSSSFLCILSQVAAMAAPCHCFDNEGNLCAFLRRNIYKLFLFFSTLWKAQILRHFHLYLNRYSNSIVVENQTQF